MLDRGGMIQASARRPYWLLLALVLFFAGQVAAAAHWHVDGEPGQHNSLDLDCALCALSSAAGAAIASTAFALASLALAAFVFLPPAQAIIAQRVHAYRSRAPPLHS